MQKNVFSSNGLVLCIVAEIETWFDALAVPEICATVLQPGVTKKYIFWNIIKS